MSHFGDVFVSATRLATRTLRSATWRRLPAANFNGAPGGLTATLIESGGATPASGTTVNLSGPGATSGSTIYQRRLRALTLDTAKEHLLVQLPAKENI